MLDRIHRTFEHLTPGSEIHDASVATNPAQRLLRCVEIGSGTGWRADRPLCFTYRALRWTAQSPSEYRKTHP